MVEIVSVPIKGCENYKISSDGKVFNKLGKELKQELNPDGSLNICITKNIDGARIQTHLSVARLVALAFLPTDEEYRFVRHKDGNKKNNNVNNIEWVTDKRKQGNPNQSRASEVLVMNMYTGETQRLVSITAFARFMAMKYPEKTEAQHLRSINHYLSFKPRFVIYYEYKLNVTVIKLTDEEISYNFNDYVGTDEAIKILGVSRPHFKNIVLRYNIRSFSQKSTFWYHKDDLKKAAQDIFVLNNYIYYKSDYNFNIIPENSEKKYGAKSVMLNNRMTGDVIFFNSLTDCATYICAVSEKLDTDKLTVEHMLQSLSKKLSQGNHSYKFFEISFTSDSVVKQANKTNKVKTVNKASYKPNSADYVLMSTIDSTDKQKENLKKAILGNINVFPFPNEIKVSDVYSLPAVAEILKLPYSTVSAMSRFGVFPTYRKDRSAKIRYIKYNDLINFLKNVRKNRVEVLEIT